MERFHLAGTCLPLNGLSGPSGSAPTFTVGKTRHVRQAMGSRQWFPWLWQFPPPLPAACANLLRPPPACAIFKRLTTNSEIEEPQCEWTGATMTILAAYARRGEYVQAAAETAGEMYGYGKVNVFLNSKASLGRVRTVWCPSVWKVVPTSTAVVKYRIP